MGTTYRGAVGCELKYVIPGNRKVSTQPLHHLLRPPHAATARELQHLDNVLVIGPVPVTEHVDSDAVVVTRHLDAGHKGDAQRGGSLTRLTPARNRVVIRERYDVQSCGGGLVHYLGGGARAIRLD